MYTSEYVLLIFYKGPATIFQWKKYSTNIAFKEVIHTRIKAICCELESAHQIVNR